MKISFIELNKGKIFQIKRFNNVLIRKQNRKIICEDESMKFKNIKDKGRF